MVTKDAVVSDMRIGHQQAVAPDDGLTTRRRTTIHRDALTYHGMITDDGDTLFADELQVLGDTCDDSTRVDMAVLT